MTGMTFVILKIKIFILWMKILLFCSVYILHFIFQHLWLYAQYAWQNNDTLSCTKYVECSAKQMKVKTAFYKRWIMNLMGFIYNSGTQRCFRRVDQGCPQQTVNQRALSSVWEGTVLSRLILRRKYYLN